MESVFLDTIGTLQERRTEEFRLTHAVWERLFKGARVKQLEEPDPSHFHEGLRDLYAWMDIRGVNAQQLIERLAQASMHAMLPLSNAQPSAAGLNLAHRFLRRTPRLAPITPLPWVAVDVIGPFLVVGHFCPFSTNFAGLPEDLLIRVLLHRSDYDRCLHSSKLGAVMATKPAPFAKLAPAAFAKTRDDLVARILDAGSHPDADELDKLSREVARARIESDPAFMQAIDQRLACVRVVPTMAMMPNPGAIEAIPRKIAITTPALCYYVAGKTLFVLLRDMLQADSLQDELCQISGDLVRVVAAQADETEIRRLLDIQNKHEAVDIQTASENMLYDRKRLLEIDPARLVDLTQTDIARLANQEEETRTVIGYFLQHAMVRSSSDLHFDPIENGTIIRARMDGALAEMGKLRGDAATRVLSSIKEIAKMDQQERATPQDGRFLFIAGTAKAEIRVSTVPVKGYEALCMRIQPKGAKRKTIDTLGMGDRAKAILLEGITAPHGIVVIAGETGSGKTTTLDAVMRYMNRPELAILSLENPVEMEGDLMKQIEINHDVGLTFSVGFKAALRQDPDIIMIGEVRDKASADAAIESSNTGHLTFCTIHTNDAPAIVNRFLELGVPPDQLSASLVLGIAQTLVKKLCTCARDRAITEEDVRLFDQADLKPALRPKCLKAAVGCVHCGGTGYHGRIPVMEMMPKTEALEELIFKRASYGEIKQCARRYGYRTMFEEAVLLAAQGTTTMDEAAKNRMPYTSLKPVEGFEENEVISLGAKNQKVVA